MARLVASLSRAHRLKRFHFPRFTAQLVESNETVDLDSRGLCDTEAAGGQDTHAGHTRSEHVQVSQAAAWWELPSLVRVQGINCGHTSSSSGAYRHSLSCYSTQQQQGPDISLLSPPLQRQWHHAKNAHLGNIVIAASSHHKVWWSCDQCPRDCKHEWMATVNNRARGRSCPFCANRKVCQHNSPATKAPAVAAEFSSRNKHTAQDFLYSSNKSVMWQCGESHEWHASIHSRTENKSGCPECFAIRNSSQPRKRHPILTDSQHPMLQYWDWTVNAEAGIDPRTITCRSGKLVNWLCQNCPKGQPHRWQAMPNKMYDGQGCPFCASMKCCACNSLLSLFPAVAAEWDFSRNKGTPADYTAHSAVRMWWSNSKRGQFQAVINNSTSRRPDFAAGNGKLSS